jgi:hypothetical protein
MEREVEYLRHQCEYLERMLENCMSCLSSLEARVVELERRPVAIALPDEPRGPQSGGDGADGELLLTHGIAYWEDIRARRR